MVYNSNISLRQYRHFSLSVILGIKTWARNMKQRGSFGLILWLTSKQHQSKLSSILNANALSAVGLADRDFPYFPTRNIKIDPFNLKNFPSRQPTLPPSAKLRFPLCASRSLSEQQKVSLSPLP
ncbi:hypothetical protein AVEN_367-1 [Araneus ventricosus]|uniref:Uncharacterized protein n=1 Tax=Araneus ventricosus TaxID=182803 RepID=A0A4Y2DV80_ARAVE|nr:hypothetical protein AVEN_367-1 [Araneus ventricosus]